VARNLKLVIGSGMPGYDDPEDSLAAPAEPLPLLARSQPREPSVIQNTR